MRYILASGSPRRRELLSKVIPEYEVIPAVSEESCSATEPSEIVEELSFQKASEIFYKVFTDKALPVVVIGADTVVSYNQRVLGKPSDRHEAEEMLRMLQGRTHCVYTGVSVMYNQDKETGVFTFGECTEVMVAPMSDEEIAAYAATGESDDKAGAYGIQGDFSKFVVGIKGDYSNVVGLPVASLYKRLKQHGLLC